tara:strand:- start:498 stop:1181 length:684 start_codon:yes stop_codon:yes gene_type:complete
MEKLKNTLEISNELDIVYSLIALVICFLTSLVLKFVYEEKSSSLTNKSQLAHMLPILSIVIFLVISVVKSSLALSLGLVGALSIVRFRTPIKDPEELVYLFIAIALGLGFGSGQIVITIIIFFSLMIFIWFYSSRKKISSSGDYNLIIESKNKERDIIEDSEFIQKTINECFENVIFVKYDKLANDNDLIVFKITLGKFENIKEFKNKLENKLKNYSINIYENNVLI